MSGETLTIRTIDELIAAVPFALGLHPENCVVLFPFDLRSAPMARLDFPATEAAWEGCLDALARPYQGRSSNLALLAYTADPDLAAAAQRRISGGLPCPIAMAVQVDGETWVRLDQPGSGTVPPTERHRFDAESVYHHGALPYATVEEHRASFRTGPHPIPAEVMRQATEATDAALGQLSTTAIERAWIWQTLNAAVRSGNRPTDPDAARLLSDVKVIALRDHAWACIDRTHSLDHGRLWKDLLTRAPDQDKTPAASLAAFAFWFGGDGPSARAALEQVPEGRPYKLADLMASVLANGMDPKAFPDPRQIQREGPPPLDQRLPSGLKHQHRQPPQPGPGPQQGPSR